MCGLRTPELTQMASQKEKGLGRSSEIRKRTEVWNLFFTNSEPINQKITNGAVIRGSHIFSHPEAYKEHREAVIGGNWVGIVGVLGQDGDNRAKWRQ
ncbi:hypothetical protein XELAEV_18043557mg [Xenopus laevis]|uniref:Uncharacterized protein n=1 Tax=Xenopus laevis TaxID=8355 RepID=A0A974BXS8_XENLA|nr:hypothetical protein XELAEV_18043557mg [Xenopus laevis]